MLRTCYLVAGGTQGCIRKLWHHAWQSPLGEEVLQSLHCLCQSEASLKTPLPLQMCAPKQGPLSLRRSAGSLCSSTALGPE